MSQQHGGDSNHTLTLKDDMMKRWSPDNVSSQQEDSSDLTNASSSPGSRRRLHDGGPKKKPGIGGLAHADDHITVMKFGGSSLKSAERIRAVADLVKSALPRKPVVVVSAIGKTTDFLVDAGRKALDHGTTDIEELSQKHHALMRELGLSKDCVNEVEKVLAELTNLLKGVALIREISRRTSDLLMSFGERLSVRIFADQLIQMGVVAKSFDAYDLGMRTCGGGGSSTDINAEAEIDPTTYDAIADSIGHLNEAYDYTAVITGFVAKDRSGQVTTLGRSGSDYSASIIGAACGAREIEIWTDVDGVQTCDPRVVDKPRCVEKLSFAEAAELAYFGAKVLHPGTMIPAMAKGIPIAVKNSFNPSHAGTVVLCEFHRPSNHLLTALTFKRDVFLIDITSTQMVGAHGFLAKVFAVFEALKISVDVIATSEVSVSLTLDNNVSHRKVEDLELELSPIADVTVKPHQAILTLIGNIGRSSQLLATACLTLQEIECPLEMVSCGASKVNITLVIPDAFATKAVRHLHESYFYSEVFGQLERRPSHF